MKYIGIDLGSSFVKAVLLDLCTQKTVSGKKCQSPKKKKNANPNIYEVSACELVHIVRAMIDEYTKVYSDIEGIIISTQMHGFVYSVLEQPDIYVSWQDMRCMDLMPGKKVSYLEWMEDTIPPEQMKNNGVYIKPSLGVCNLYTLLEQKRLSRNGTLYTLGSYVIHALTGNNICHISNAAPLGLADVAHHCWDEVMLERMELQEIQLPQLAKTDYEVCGTYHSNGVELKVYPDYGDMQVAVLGSCIGEGDVTVNIATGAQVIRYAKEYVPGAYEIRPYFEKSYLNTISNMPAGRNLDVLVNFLRETIEQLTGQRVDVQDVWRRVHEMKLVKESELKVETSFYKNPYFPDGGAIKGINHDNLHLETLFQSAFEDMANTYWKYIKMLGNPEEIYRIVCAGGVSWKTPELYQMIGQVTGKHCELSPMPDEALSGMCQLSLLCSGLCSSIEECRRNYSKKW